MKGSELLEVRSGLTERSSLRAVSGALLEPELLGAVTALRALLTQGLTEEQRQTRCTASVVYLLSKFEPREPGGPCTRQTSLRFVRSCSPLSMSLWSAHLDIMLSAGKEESARVSEYLYQILCAAEDLWGVRGHLVRRDDEDPA